MLFFRLVNYPSPKARGFAARSLVNGKSITYFDGFVSSAPCAYTILLHGANNEHFGFSWYNEPVHDGCQYRESVRYEKKFRRN